LAGFGQDGWNARSLWNPRAYLKPNARRAQCVAVLGAAVLAVCGGAKAAPAALAPLRTPRDALIALYRLPSIPVTPGDKQRFFAGDMASALIKDSERDDEVGIATDGDYRYDAQDFNITALHIDAMTIRNEGATLRVVYQHLGKPQTVTYELCSRRPGDWRIKDVITHSGGSLRKLLGLVPVAQSKGC